MKQVLRTSLVLDGVFSLCRYVVEGGGGLCAVSFIRTPIPVMGPPLPTSSPPKVAAPTPIPLGVRFQHVNFGAGGCGGGGGHINIPATTPASLMPLGPTPALSSVRFPVSGHESCGRRFRQVAKAPRPDIAPPSSIPPLGGGAAAPGGSSLLCPAVPHRLVTVCTAFHNFLEQTHCCERSEKRLFSWETLRFCSLWFSADVLAASPEKADAGRGQRRAHDFTTSLKPNDLAARSFSQISPGFLGFLHRCGRAINHPRGDKSCDLRYARIAAVCGNAINHGILITRRDT